MMRERTQSYLHPLHFLKHVRNEYERFSCVSSANFDDVLASESTYSNFQSVTSIQHKITERGGGRELWIQAPVLLDEMEIQMQSFGWSKRWKRRCIQLNGRRLCCFNIESSKKRKKDNESKKSRMERTYRNSLCGLFSDTLDEVESSECSGSQEIRNEDQSDNKITTIPHKVAELKPGASLQYIDTHTFAIVPCPTEKPWILRIRDPVIRKKWHQACTDCIDIINWIQHYEIGQVLGVGGHGIVKVVTDTRSNQQFAMKTVDVSKLKNRNTIVKEVEILRDITRHINHPNLVRIEKVYEENEKINIIMQYCGGGELYDAIVKRGRYNESDAIQIMQQLLSALQALHRHNILHLDIKPENILLESPVDCDNDGDKVPRLVLTDFGLAQTICGSDDDTETDGLRSGISGTVGYIAPEVITSRLYTPAADVFSAGVILFILLVGYPPFYGESDIETMLMTARGEYCLREEDWKQVSEEARDLVTRMLTIRMQDRISLDEVLQHPWIQNKQDIGQEGLHMAIGRIEKFNFNRRSKRFSSFITKQVLPPDAEVVTAPNLPLSVNLEMIQSMFDQLAPDGKLKLKHARRLVQGFGFCPFVSEKLVIGFLDQDQDGFITAIDYWKSIQAIYYNHASFSVIMFEAFLTIRSHVYQHQKRGTSHYQLANLSRDKKYRNKLTQADFMLAFSILQCSEAHAFDFFRHCYVYLSELKNKETNKVSDTRPIDSFGSRTASMSSDASFASHSSLISMMKGSIADENVGFVLNREMFAEIFSKFPFLRSLFLVQNSRSKSKVQNFATHTMLTRYEYGYQ